MSIKGGLISAVAEGSPAQLAGIRPGERLLAVNSLPVLDLIDYLSLTAEDRLTLTISGQEGPRELVIEKKGEESPGLVFDEAVFDGIRRCANRCVFCFIDQLPAGLRPTLYIKDEDYRLSFLQGNYVTLAGLRREDLARILRYRLSPLYISVHATDPVVRGRLLGQAKPAPILPLLRRLVAGGICLQVQIVLCPGWNDGAVLDRSLDDLAALGPGLGSIALVPVGLTAHRDSLPLLEPFGRETSASLLRQIEPFQRRFQMDRGTRFVFPADEFFLLAGVPIPPAAYYEDYLQWENGVGLIRAFEDDFRIAWRRWRGKIKPGTLRVVTGVAAAGMWQRLARLLRRSEIDLQILAVPNRFLGTSITVTGLLAGADIAAALEGLERLPTFVPRVVCQKGGSLLLDGMSVEELVRKTQMEVIETDAAAFLAAAARALR